MSATPEFVEFPKMPRLSREIIVTEKIDGTNAKVLITPGYHSDPLAVACWTDEAMTDMVMYAGSRTRWITPSDDNFGFAAWVAANAEELKNLGHGSHFGEWWGAGIQRRYGLTEKRFSLFNVDRWGETRPTCCHVVPVLYRGDFDTARIEWCLQQLRNDGSLAAPGFMNPEGVVVFHLAGRVGFKKTLHKDEVPKALAGVS
jgi:hypothetical protein